MVYSQRVLSPQQPATTQYVTGGPITNGATFTKGVPITNGTSMVIGTPVTAGTRVVSGPIYSAPSSNATTVYTSPISSTVGTTSYPTFGAIQGATTSRMVPTLNSPPAINGVVSIPGSYPAGMSQSVAPVAYNRVMNAAPALSAGGGTQNVLSTLNAQRSRQGLRSLIYDPSLQAVAQRRAQLMASMGTKTHPPGSFSPGRYEGVGWSSSYSNNAVYACYTSDPSMTYAGAAMATGRDGVYFCVVYR
ncbi:MAG: CAP domain-containing protein [Planctomycetota bacterium]